ncbi:MAG: hypothetical protein ACXVCY_11890 [Pseudobdellovibrionaceae bacterium]
MKKTILLILGLQLIVDAALAGGLECQIKGTCGGFSQTQPIIIELKPGQICKTRAC